MIKPTTQKHFEVFKTECRRWLKALMLDDWHIYFGWEYLDNSYSLMRVNIMTRALTLVFCKNWETDGQPLTNANVKLSARHEVYHVLIAEITGLMELRYVSSEEVYAATERVVNKLETILPDHRQIKPALTDFSRS